MVLFTDFNNMQHLISTLSGISIIQNRSCRSSWVSGFFHHSRWVFTIWHDFSPDLSMIFRLDIQTLASFQGIFLYFIQVFLIHIGPFHDFLQFTSTKMIRPTITKSLNPPNGTFHNCCWEKPSTSNNKKRFTWISSHQSPTKKRRLHTKTWPLSQLQL